MLLLTLVASLAATSAKAAPESPIELRESTESVAPAAVALPPFLVEDEEKDGKWHGSFTLGASYVTGNTETRAVDAAADAKRRTEDDRWTFRGWWNYSEQTVGSTDERTLNDRKAGLTGQYDYFLSERMYALGTAGVDTDYQANIDVRYDGGAGLGYQFVETDTVTLQADAALTYTYREIDVDGPGTEDEDYLGVRGAYAYGHQLKEKLRFDHLGEATQSLEDDIFYGKLDTKLRLDLTDSFFTHLQWVLEYNDPATGEKLADNRVLLGVGWSF